MFVAVMESIAARLDTPVKQIENAPSEGKPEDSLDSNRWLCIEV